MAPRIPKFVIEIRKQSEGRQLIVDNHNDIEYTRQRAQGNQIKDSVEEARGLISSNCGNG